MIAPSLFALGTRHGHGPDSPQQSHQVAHTHWRPHPARPPNGNKSISPDGLPHSRAALLAARVKP
eukprot:scaffold5781_cov124-Isochrysis_galbana.AAC.7